MTAIFVQKCGRSDLALNWLAAAACAQPRLSHMSCPTVGASDLDGSVQNAIASDSDQHQIAVTNGIFAHQSSAQMCRGDGTRM